MFATEEEAKASEETSKNPTDHIFVTWWNEVFLRQSLTSWKLLVFKQPTCLRNQLICYLQPDPQASSSRDMTLDLRDLLPRSVIWLLYDWMVFQGFFGGLKRYKSSPTWLFQLDWNFSNSSIRTTDRLYTLLGTKIYPFKGIFESMIFQTAVWWDMFSRSLELYNITCLFQLFFCWGGESNQIQVEKWISPTKTSMMHSEVLPPEAKSSEMVRDLLREAIAAINSGGKKFWGKTVSWLSFSRCNGPPKKTCIY